MKRDVKKWKCVGMLVAGAAIALLSVAASAQKSYSFAPVAYLTAPAPGGATFIDDFEPSGLNNRGDLAFTADLAPFGEEGVFLMRAGALSQVVRYDMPAPGGGTFGPGELGNIGFNDAGDLGVAFSIGPGLVSFPTCLPGSASNAYYAGGIYRRSHISQQLEAVVTPGVTPAPGGGSFLGVGFNVTLNNRGELAFAGAVNADCGQTLGIFVAGKKGGIATVAGPITPGPAGGTFELATDPWINDGGDVAFDGWVSTDLVQNVYVKSAATGQFTAVTHTGQAVPGGGTLVAAASPIMNDTGQIVFSATVLPGSGPPIVELLLYSGGSLVHVAGPGDAMPGGGNITLLGAAAVGGPSQFRLNNRGDVVFNAALDTGEEGLYVYSHGAVSLVAKTGTAIPGVGTLFDLEQFVNGLIGPIVGKPASFIAANDRGQIAFACTLADGSGALLLATPAR